LFIAGVEYGGSLATLLTASLIADSVNINKLYTYGSPRVGNGNFIKWLSNNFGYNNERVRVVNYQDPTVDYAFYLNGFRNIQPEVFYFNNSAGYEICHDERTGCSAQFRNLT
jgi:predicted lipase